MRKTDKGKFNPKNPAKYIGEISKITYRSSWELTVMLWLDTRPEVIAWSSEGQKVSYQNPLNGKWTVYIPDFIVVIENEKGIRSVEMVEIKPMTQVPGHRTTTKTGKPQKISKYNLAEQVRNEAKWKAAIAYCAKRGWKFQVLTEQSIFGHKREK